MDAVQGLQLLLVLRGDTIQVPAERGIEGLGDVVALLPGGLGHLGPTGEDLGGLVQHRLGLGDQPVVRQRDAGRAPGGELGDGGEGLVEVEVRRRGGRAQDAGVGQTDPDGVAHEEQAAERVVQAEVVLGVPRGVDGREDPSGTDDQLVAVLEHVDPGGFGRRQAPVQRVEEVPVDHGRRVDQSARVDQVAGPLLVDVDRGLREGEGHVAHPAGVVEVDVGDHDVGQVLGLEAQPVQRREQGGHRGLATGLDQGRLRSLEQIPGGDPLPAPQQGVDLEHVLRDARGHNGTMSHPGSRFGGAWRTVCSTPPRPCR